MNNNRDPGNNLLSIFNLKNTLEIKDEEQLKRIRKKMNLLIDSKKLDFLFIAENNKKADNMSTIKFKNIQNSTVKELYYKEVILKNTAFALISIGAYLYFNKYTGFLNTVNSIYYYKKLFLITFCVVPFFLNYNFSKMNYEYKLLELKLGKDVDGKLNSKNELQFS